LKKIKNILKRIYAIFEDIKDKNLRVSVIITLCVIFAGALIYGVKNIGYSKIVLLKKADDYYVQEHYFKAAQYYSKAADLDRNNPEIYFAYASALVKTGNFDAAIKNFKKVLDINPGNAEAYYALGDAYCRKAALGNNASEYDNAEAALAKAIEAAPNMEKAYVLMGECLRANAKTDEARFWYSKALTVKGFDKAGFYNLIGHTFFEEKKYKEASDYYGKAVAANPSFVAAYCNLGDMLVKMGDDQNAIETYAKAADVNWKSAIAYVKMAEIYYKRVEYDSVLDMCVKALSVNPEDAKANYLTGMVYRTWGRESQGIDYLKRAAYYGSDEAVVELRNAGVDLR